MPDQYTLSAFQRAERAAPGRAPVMAEVDLLSSHAPWDAGPASWSTGTRSATASVYDDPDRRRRPGRASCCSATPTGCATDYGSAIDYSLGTLISYVQTYGDDNLVLIFLGDHQPAPVVTGDGATRDVPVTIVARDPAVLDRISGWGWQDGLRPSPQAPVWRMDTFRDRFLSTFSSP